jgi:hypothetical protein
LEELEGELADHAHAVSRADPPGSPLANAQPLRHPQDRDVELLLLYRSSDASIYFPIVRISSAKIPRRRDRLTIPSGCGNLVATRG